MVISIPLSELFLLWVRKLTTILQDNLLTFYILETRTKTFVVSLCSIPVIFLSVSLSLQPSRHRLCTRKLARESRQLSVYLVFQVLL